MLPQQVLTAPAPALPALQSECGTRPANRSAEERADQAEVV
jgi:hypothetical protein